MKDYVALANQYIADVLSGKQPAGKWVRLACERQLNDLQRSRFEFEFDAEEANRRCAFIELLPHIKGTWDSETIQLQPWQCFVICTLFGWRHKKTGFRRFKTMLLGIPRKNGKSSLAAAMALSCFCLDDEPGAELYSAATKEDQAKEVFGVAKAMIKKLLTDVSFKRRFGIEVNAKNLSIPSRESLFTTVSNQSDRLDGLNVHLSTMDELHAHKSAALFNVVNDGMGARNQPLMLIITTAGFILDGVCTDKLTYLKKILQKVITDHSFFGVWYDAEECRPKESAKAGKLPWWAQERTLKIANPNYNVSLKPDFLQSKISAARANPADVNNFLTKFLNIFCNTATAYINLDAWDQCPDDAQPLEAYAGCRCWIGVDLAQKWDLCSVAYLFERDDGYLKLFVRNYIPKQRLIDDHQMRDQYNAWEQAGYIIATEGEVTDYEYIKADIENATKMFNVQVIAFDPAQANELANVWVEYTDITVVEVPQRASQLSESQKKLAALIIEKKIDHGNDPCLKWQASNIVVRNFADGTILFRKEKEYLKIDGMVAGSMSVKGWFELKPPESSVYEERGIRSL